MENPKILREIMMMMMMMMGDDNKYWRCYNTFKSNGVNHISFIYIYNFNQANEAKSLPRLPSER